MARCIREDCTDRAKFRVTSPGGMFMVACYAHVEWLRNLLGVK